MKAKIAFLVALAALHGASFLSAETSLRLDVAFGIRYVPPSNVTVPVGERLTITAPAMGADALWFRNAHPITGASNPTLVIPSASVNDAGTYVYTTPGPGIPERGSQLLLLNVGAQQRFLNLSTRALAGTGEQTLIAGFVVGGPDVKAVLIRAVGPSLAKFGLTGFIREPIITIYDSAGRLYTEDYVYPAVVGGDKKAAIAAATKKTGAFPLLAESKDAVDLRPFRAGAYTVHVTSSDASTGTALVELFEVP
jgi:hypothetical protein